MKKTAKKPLRLSSEWSFELIDEIPPRDRPGCARFRPRHLSDPGRGHHRRTDDGRLRLGGHARELSPLVVRQAIPVHREGLPARADGLAYEIVINSNPCIAYLMEENTMTMQALVIAHAAYGHNSFFKGNYLFRTWTNADAIVDYLLFARSYIAQCEERYGVDEVELLLDSCHALMNVGVDRYKRPQALHGKGKAAPAGPRDPPAKPGQRAVAHPARLRRTRRSSERASLPARTRGEPALLHREERATARAAGSVRWCGSCAKDRPVLLSPKADPGHERRLGDLLALHPAQPAL